MISPASAVRPYEAPRRTRLLQIGWHSELLSSVSGIVIIGTNQTLHLLAVLPFWLSGLGSQGEAESHPLRLIKKATTPAVELPSLPANRAVVELRQRAIVGKCFGMNLLREWVDRPILTGNMRLSGDTSWRMLTQNKIAIEYWSTRPGLCQSTSGRKFLEDRRRSGKTWLVQCVELDIQDALPEEIILKVPVGSNGEIQEHKQAFDYEQLPFKCNRCHQYGHFSRVEVARGESRKNRAGA
ncbi:hypothetical protein MRB53_036585 [Persea americana]|nr:hypothetical protein MRB53_042432 [Persea americana]KAJ8613997.1 hypothetical protein MRB53_036723 [Persea americana]KAJ8614387.1 hypothetical protein MRB53_036585 [Persea americana]